MSKQHKYPSLADVKQGFANTSVATVRAQNNAFLLNSAKYHLDNAVDKTAGIASDLTESMNYMHNLVASRC